MKLSEKYLSRINQLGGYLTPAEIAVYAKLCTLEASLNLLSRMAPNTMLFSEEHTKKIKASELHNQLQTQLNALAKEKQLV